MQTDSGWQIDHRFPESKDGTNQLGNLQPLHWLTNKSKDDGPDKPELFSVRRS